MSEVEKITLDKPFDGHAGERFTAIYLKEPDAGKLRKIKGNIKDDLFDMTCQYVQLCGGDTEACSGLPASIVNKISGPDLNQKVMPVFLGFFGDSPETGENSSEQ